MANTADKTPPGKGRESAHAAPTVEMTDLQSNATTSNPTAGQASPQQHTLPTPSPPPPSSIHSVHPSSAPAPTVDAAMPGTTDATKESSADVSSPPDIKPKSTAPAQLNRSETEAIGPSSEYPMVKTDPAGGPAVIITLLLASGARHPYKIDEKYLKKRNVTVEEMDPFNVSVYTLKELILRDWREEWEPKPNAPSSIRLIYMGRMLDDRDKLRECRFNEAAPNVVHMTIKPQELVDDEEAAKTGKGHARDRDGEERTAGCRCVIL